jgi:hypothetical protein
MDDASDQRTHTNPEEDHRQKEREHRAEGAQQDGEMTEPQDLDAHRRESRHRQREAREHQRRRHRVRLPMRVRLKPDITYGSPYGFAFRSVRLQPDRGTRRQIERSHARQDVETRGDHLGPLQADRRYQREVRQEATERRARGVGGVQQRNSPRAIRQVAPNQMTNEQRQRSAHQERDRRQENDRNDGAGEIRRCREDEPACRFTRIGRDECRDLAEVRQERGDAQPHQSDDELHVRVGAHQRLGLCRIPAIGPRSDEVAAGAKPRHEHGDHERGRVDRVAEDVAERPHPDDLVDQTADARAEEEQVQHDLLNLSGKARGKVEK